MLKHVHTSPSKKQNLDSIEKISDNAITKEIAPDSVLLLKRGDSVKSVDESLTSDFKRFSCSDNSNGKNATSANCPCVGIKFYVASVRPDIEYKTLNISYQTTSQEVIKMLLTKLNIRYHDLKLFYLIMEVKLMKAMVQSVFALVDDARPAELQACHPRGQSSFHLKTRMGGVIKVYNQVLGSGSHYKSLKISENTTADDVINLILNSFNSSKGRETFSIHVVSKKQQTMRELSANDYPLRVKETWIPEDQCYFLLQKQNINS